MMGVLRDTLYRPAQNTRADTIRAAVGIGVLVDSASTPQWARALTPAIDSALLMPWASMAG